MPYKEKVIKEIREAFGANAYPGDAFLQGSFEGCEPCEEVGAFIGKTDWSTLEAAMLDRHYSALSFFSEADFRFFLPAYLLADVRSELRTADPVFHLTAGFVVSSTEIPTASRVFVRKAGGSILMNPKRYGAMTFEDYARFRLSVFTREEAKAIVAYLQVRREGDLYGVDRSRIDAALTAFWLERAEHAPSRERLEQHLQAEQEFLTHLGGRAPEKTGMADPSE
jgi:hypothetical protein